VHRYDVFAGDRKGVVEEFRGGDWPTLGEVLEELRIWYYANLDFLK